MKKEPCKLFSVRKRNKNSVAVEDVSVSPICQCHKGFRCPKKHTDPGSLPARAYIGLDIKTYSAYCVPTHHSDAVYTLWWDWMTRKEWRKWDGCKKLLGIISLTALHQRFQGNLERWFNWTTSNHPWEISRNLKSNRIKQFTNLNALE